VLGLDAEGVGERRDRGRGIAGGGAQPTELELDRDPARRLDAALELADQDRDQALGPAVLAMQRRLGPQRLGAPLVEASRGLVGGQGGDVVAALGLLELADLEVELGGAPAIAGPLGDAQPHRDRLVPLPPVLVEPGQLVGGVEIVGGQGLGLLEDRRGPGADRRARRPGARRARATPRPCAPVDTTSVAQLREHDDSSRPALGLAVDRRQRDLGRGIVGRRLAGGGERRPPRPRGSGRAPARACRPRSGGPRRRWASRVAVAAARCSSASSPRS
jgi:hypothetical protein